MKQYIAVVSSDAGKITKYQDFDTQAEADTHVADFGGFVSAKPSDSTGYWVVGVDTLTYDAAWKTYRAALRDLPASQADPDDIVFPDAP